MIEGSESGSSAAGSVSDRLSADGGSASGEESLTGSPATQPVSQLASGQMTITFKLYATLQDLLPSGAKKNAVSIEVAADTTLNDIIDRYQVPRELAHLVLVNGVFVCDTDRDAPGALKPGDVLAIWPPVAGG